uniref:hypothetical protein n=1 Tax=Pseudomonas sp. RW407 TaxID=2202894 RepID=UPI0011B6EDAC|nr:hypothetical protein [Pseudomonas sp. RW407]
MDSFEKGVSGAVVVLVSAYALYLVTSFGATAGAGLTVADYKSCLQLAVQMPGSKAQAEVFLLELEKRLNFETTAADTVRVGASVASALNGHLLNEPSLSSEMRKCIGDLQQEIRRAKG